MTHPAAHIPPDPSAACREFGARHLEPLLFNLRRAAIRHPDPAVAGRIRAELERVEHELPDDDGVADLRRREIELRAFCYRNDLPEVLALSGVPSVYNFRDDFEVNALFPWDRFPDREVTAEGRRWRVLGRDIGYPIGVPASVLTGNVRFTNYFARRGFNVLTSKTIRSEKWDPHRQRPHWIYLRDLAAPLPVSEGYGQLPVFGDEDTYLQDPCAFSTANSFGVPSPPMEVWQADLEQTLERLGDGQLLVASVMGSSEKYTTLPELEDDFIRVARSAAEVGVDAVELNLSCPNTLDGTGSVGEPLCLADPAQAARIVNAVRDQIDPAVALVAKLSWMSTDALFGLLELCAGSLQGVAGINTLQMIVRRPGGQNPAFEGRDKAGISGIAIRDFGRDFTRSLAHLRIDQHWTFDILAMGGVMIAEDVRVLMRLGADVVQTATAASQNPALPRELDRETDDVLTDEAIRVLDVLDDRPEAIRDESSLASAALLPLSAVRYAISELRSHGLVGDDVGSSDSVRDAGLTGQPA